MEILTSNPFTGSYKVRAIRTYYNETNLKKLLESSTDSKEFYEYEIEPKVAVYPNVDFIDILLKEAKPITLRLYVYIINNSIKEDIDYVELDFKKVQSYLSTSRNNLYLAIDQLRDFRFIAPGKGRGNYWLNTHLAFRGSRIDYLNKVHSDSIKIVKTTSQYL